jgi:hypothetical protein
MKHTIEFFRNTIAEKGELCEQERVLLFLLPLIHVAWAHSAISPREALVIFEAAREEGIDARHWFNEKLDSFLVYQPSARFFEECLEVIHEELSRMTVREREAAVGTLLRRCEAVAAAAGDKTLMDTNHRVTPEERRVLDQLRVNLGKRRTDPVTVG